MGENPTATKGRPETPNSAQRESKRHQCKTTDTQKAATGTPEGKPRESHMRKPPRLRIKRRRPEMAPKESPTESKERLGAPKSTNPRACAQKKTARKDAHREPTRVRRETGGAQQRPKGPPKSQKGPHFHKHPIYFRLKHKEHNNKLYSNQPNRDSRHNK